MPWFGRVAACPICAPRLLPSRLQRRASCAWQPRPATSSPVHAVRRAATRPLNGLIWPKDGWHLDRLSRNGSGATFFPWPPAIPRGNQESPAAAILRCAPASWRGGRASQRLPSQPRTTDIPRLATLPCRAAAANIPAWLQATLSRTPCRSYVVVAASNKPGRDLVTPFIEGQQLRAVLNTHGRSCVAL